MSWDLKLFVWISSHILHIVFAVLAIPQKRTGDEKRKLGALITSMVTTIFPLVCLVFFLRVFVLGGSSNVAQFAGEERMKLWSLWFSVWGYLFLSTSLAFVINLVAVVCPPYLPRYSVSFLSRVCAVVATCFAFDAVSSYLPDA